MIETEAKRVIDKHTGKANVKTDSLPCYMSVEYSLRRISSAENSTLSKSKEWINKEESPAFKQHTVILEQHGLQSTGEQATWRVTLASTLAHSTEESQH